MHDLGHSLSTFMLPEQFYGLRICRNFFINPVYKHQNDSH